MKYIRLILVIFCLLPLRAWASDSTSTSHKLIHAQWYSHSEQFYRFVDIYVPPACAEKAVDDSSDDYYPVLYLLPGIGGYEGSWEEMANACDTLDSLIASGRCKPTILVMPDCGRWPVMSRPSYHNRTLWTCMLRYPGLIHEHQVEYALSDLIDMIDTTFCVSSCTVAGLSDGARMAINLANKRPDRIRKLAVFSPVWYKDQIPQDSTQTYYIYAGKRDYFYPYGQRFLRFLEQTGQPHQWIVFDEKHNWPMWRKCLSHYLQCLKTE